MKKRVLCFLLSAMLIVTLIPQVSFANETETPSDNLITGFAELETTDYYYEGNPDEGELTLNLPETLQVYIGENEIATDIYVSWEAVENFDDTDFYFYSMKPVWSEEYELADSLSEILDVPWITVYKQEPQNDEIEPILTEEEIEPIYTEEEGAIDPEVAGVSDIAEAVTGALSFGFAKVLNSLSYEAYAANTTNTDAIYKHLTEVMGLNTAAACGVMTNINAESAMSPINLQNTYNKSIGLSDEEYTKRVDKGKGSYKNGAGKTKNFKSDSAGYGLCQWTSSGRKGNLLDVAVSNKISIGDINMQMAFLNTELQNSYSQVFKTLKSVPNTAAGAYIAAVEFCMCYEIPANTVATAASRGKTCLSGYWETYSGSKASVSGTSFTSLCGYTYPKAIKNGKGLTVKGYVLSNYNIKSVTGKILNSNGKAVYSKTFKPEKTAYSLYNLDDYMKFSKLSNGTYKYVISATDYLGKTVSATHSFKVTTSGSTLSELGFASIGMPAATETKPEPTTPSETTAPTKPSTSSSTTNEGTSASEQKVTPVKSTYKGAYPKLPKRGYFKKGDKGKEVKKLQVLLNWCGCKVTTGGTYGTKTIKAVKKLQKTLGVKQDGKFGKQTLNKIKKLKR